MCAYTRAGLYSILPESVYSFSIFLPQNLLIFAGLGKNLNSSFPFGQVHVAFKFCLPWTSLILLFSWFSSQMTCLTVWQFSKRRINLSQMTGQLVFFQAPLYLLYFLCNKFKFILIIKTCIFVEINYYLQDTFILIMQILQEFKKWGATGLLVEYEDVFPYKEKYEVLRSKNSYRYTVLINIMLCLSAYMYYTIEFM